VTVNLSWSKPLGVPRSPNRYGFTDVNLTAIAGSGAFSAPAMALFNNLSLNFSAGNWSSNSANIPNFSQGFQLGLSQITPKSPLVNNVKPIWNRRTGLFLGTFKDSQSRLGRFQGVMLNNGADPLKLRGNFQLPNTATLPTFYLGGSVEN